MASVATMALNASEFRCTEMFCDFMIDKDFEEGGDDTADEYESGNIGDDSA